MDAKVKIVVNFCTGKLNRLRMKVKILVNSSIRKVDSIAFKEFHPSIHIPTPTPTWELPSPPKRPTMVQTTKIYLQVLEHM